MMHFIFLLIVWNTSLFTSGDIRIHHRLLQGCRAVIPCQHSQKHFNSFEWYYLKDTQSSRNLIYSREKTGLEHRPTNFPFRMKVSRNGSLILDCVKKVHQGLYWCQSCFQQQCWRSPHTAITVEKEILNETRKTDYVVAGSNFTHACSMGQFINLEWTFEESNMFALRNLVRGSQSHFLTSNKSINILNVKGADAGKYTCWKSGCSGQKQKLLTINLCVITVNISEVSADSCAVICDIKPNRTLNVTTGTRRISVLVHPNGSVNCSVKQVFDGYSTSNNTPKPSNTLNTTDIPTEPEYQFSVIYGPSAALLWLILMALLIYYRARLLQVFPAHYCCRGLNSRAEEEPSVVYSSMVFIRTQKTTNYNMVHNKSSCVYSEIKLKREVTK